MSNQPVQTLVALYKVVVLGDVFGVCSGALHIKIAARCVVGDLISHPLFREVTGLLWSRAPRILLAHV